MERIHNSRTTDAKGASLETDSLELDCVRCTQFYLGTAQQICHSGPLDCLRVHLSPDAAGSGQLGSGPLDDGQGKGFHHCHNHHRMGSNPWSVRLFVVAISAEMAILISTVSCNSMPKKKLGF